MRREPNQHAVVHRPQLADRFGEVLIRSRVQRRKPGDDTLSPPGFWIVFQASGQLFVECFLNGSDGLLGEGL